MIANVQDRQLRKLANSNSNLKEIWSAVRSVGNQSRTNNLMSECTPDAVNNYFASISSDEDYNLSDILSLMNDVTDDDFEAMRCNEVTEPEVERLLRSLKNTAPSNDNIPCWVFKSCSYELAGIVCHIINTSLSPAQYQAAGLRLLLPPFRRLDTPKIYQTLDLYLSHLFSRD